MSSPKPTKRALVIENEYEVDNSVEAFLKDNPTLFEHVNKQTFCLNRKVADLFQFIPEVDTIIIATTFMYPDQVLEYCEAFLKLPADMKFNFFIHSPILQFNEWKKCQSWDRDRIALRAAIIQIINAGHRLFDFAENRSSKDIITDEYGHYSPTRRPYFHHEIKYDLAADLFYLEGREYYSLKDVQDDEK